MTTIDFDAVNDCGDKVRADNAGRWPWMIVGVFGVNGDRGPFSDFCYSVGAHDHGPHAADFWCPTVSIEGRWIHPDLCSQIMNRLIAGVHAGVVNPGDDVAVPVGIPDESGAWERDANAMFWIGNPVDDHDHSMQCNMSPVDRVIPILWSSPLGWRE